MELRPGYKRTEVGVIPEDWTVHRLGEVATVRDGTHQTPRYVSTGVPFYSVEHVTSGDFSDTKFISDEEHRFLTRSCRIERGDVLMTRIGSIGHCRLVDWEVNASFYVSLALLKFFGVDARFFVQYSESKAFLDDVDRRSLPLATPKKINLGPISDVRVAVPPPAEQRAIATALGDVDALLGALDRLIAKKRNLKQAAMQQLLTGQTRLPGFSGQWKLRRLGDHAVFLNHGANSRAELTTEGRVRYLHYGDVHGSKGLLLNPSVETMPYLPPHKANGLDRLATGDLVIADASEDLDGIGKGVELTSVGTLEVVSGLHTIAVRFDKDVLADGFKAYLQHCAAFRGQLRRLAAGTKVYATNRSHVASVEIALPRVDEQIAIAAVLSDMDAEIEALEARRAKTRDIKLAMMQELLTGRTRLV